MDDDRLMAAVAKGDQAALREVFTQHAPWLAARLRRTLPADAVEDVLQETFIAVWRGAAGYQADGRLGGWIWGIARRQAALWARRNGRPDLMAEPTSAVDSCSAALGNVESIAISHLELEQALATLGAAGTAQRELVRLVFIEDRSLAEVAACLGIPQGTVKSRVYAVRRLLRLAFRHVADEEDAHAESS